MRALARTLRGPMMNAKLYDYIMSLPIVDSYELLPPRAELRQPRDVIAELLSDAPASALLSAGLEPGKLELALGDQLSVREKWKLISRHWELAAHTPACRAADLAACELYGIDEIDEDTIEAYDAIFRLTFSESRYEYILKERCHIEFALLFGEQNSLTEPLADRRYFKPAGDISSLVSPQSAEEVHKACELAKIGVSAFDDYLEACARLLLQISGHCKVIYCTKAPLPLPSSYSDARSAFAALISGQRSDGCEAVQRYVFRHLMSLAETQGLTVRLDDGGAESISYAELFTLYPKLKFDILVSESPGRRELSRFAATLPNVYANFSKAPGAAAEYLGFVPYSKLVFFGGGCRTIDAVYGRVQIARETLARVLSQYIASGIFSLRRAETAARAMLFENAKNLYNAQPAA